MKKPSPSLRQLRNKGLRSKKKGGEKGETCKRVIQLLHPGRQSWRRKKAIKHATDKGDQPLVGGKGR